MDEKEKGLCIQLGKIVHQWVKEGKLKFVYPTESKEISKNLKKYLELIDYLLNKQRRIEEVEKQMRSVN